MAHCNVLRRDELRVAQTKRAIALGLRHKGLRASLNGWRGISAARRETLSTLSRAGGALLCKELRAAYVRWAVAAARAAATANVLHFAVLRWVGRRVGAAWRRWAAASAAALAAEMRQITNLIAKARADCALVAP